MPEPPAISREDLYAHWYEWAIANLGHNPKLASIAATAATEAAIGGSGFNSAAESARSAWNGHTPSAQAPKSFRRLDAAAALSIACGFASIIAPLDTSFTFPLFAILGILIAVHAFWRGRVIGGFVGVCLSLLGGIISLFSMWGGSSYI